MKWFIASEANPCLEIELNRTNMSWVFPKIIPLFHYVYMLDWEELIQEVLTKSMAQ